MSPSKTAESRSAVEALRRFLAAVERLDAPACAAAFTDDGTMHTPCLPSTIPRTRRGSKEIAESFDFLFTAVLKKFSWIDLEVHATDDPALVFATARSSAVLTDGRPYSNEYAIYARSEDGRLKEYTEFFDTERASGAFKHLAT